jgi:hypothetical protein
VFTLWLTAGSSVVHVALPRALDIGVNSNFGNNKKGIGGQRITVDFTYKAFILSRIFKDTCHTSYKSPRLRALLFNFFDLGVPPPLLRF